MVKDERLRVPVDDPYLLAIGRAAYVFATLEWNVVWCSELINNGYIQKIGNKTAGRIANDFIKRANTLTDPKIRSDAVSLADEFHSLVKLRNDIFHGKPGTDVKNDNAQRLFRHGVALDIAAIDEISDQFAHCSQSLNALLHGSLKQLPSVPNREQ